MPYLLFRSRNAVAPPSRMFSISPLHSSTVPVHESLPDDLARALHLHERSDARIEDERVVEIVLPVGPQVRAAHSARGGAAIWSCSAGQSKGSAHPRSSRRRAARCEGGLRVRRLRSHRSLLLFEQLRTLCARGL